MLLLMQERHPQRMPFPKKSEMEGLVWASRSFCDREKEDTSDSIVYCGLVPNPYLSLLLLLLSSEMMMMMMMIRAIS